ncbi:MAG: hypothetical protein Q8R28_11475 [Dehalococcoidia bacterium]|nr:hypothetical protein [Dehalococcoidia bacterium]
MTTPALIRSLEAVPMYHLAILDLARELQGPEGIDGERAAERAGEIEAAIKEAGAYVKAVKALFPNIQALPAIHEGPP